MNKATPREKMFAIGGIRSQIYKFVVLIASIVSAALALPTIAEPASYYQCTPTIVAKNKDACPNLPFSVEGWRKLEADNGSLVAMNLRSLARDPQLGVFAAICFQVDGDHCPPENIVKVLFDCRGHYQTWLPHLGTQDPAPPRSVIGKFSEIACTAR